MVAQRRYSVTGQTPLDAADATTATAMATFASLDSDRPSEQHGLEQCRGRQMTPAGPIVRTSSKRSATQLPSPTSPSQQLPPKIARYQLDTDGDVGKGEEGILDLGMDLDIGTAITVEADIDVDTDTDSDITNVSQDGSERGDKDTCFDSLTVSTPSTPSMPAYSRPTSAIHLPDASSLEYMQLCVGEGLDDDCMEHLALSPPHSRNHSLVRMDIDDSERLQESWVAFQSAALAAPSHSPIQLQHIDIPSTAESDLYRALTFLTLPPEIRHQIYRHCDNIVMEKPLVYCISTFDGEMQHPLASVSRQVRSEALAIFYSYNTWVIKVEFQIMYEAFQDWIIRLGEGASLLRLVVLSVRGALFKPKKALGLSMALQGPLMLGPLGTPIANGIQEQLYSPPDGDASFKIDLSEKHVGGLVTLMRNDGTEAAGEKATAHLSKMVHGLWEKRRSGTLNGQDWVNMVDTFSRFIGGC